MDAVPENASVVVGENTVFECQAASVLDIVSWTKDDEALTQTDQIIMVRATVI